MTLAVAGATFAGERIGLRVEDGLIAELGPGVVPRAGDEVIDGGGLALVEGLVNGHTHAAMTLFRGYADDLPLMTWLEDHIWPAERRLEADDVYWGTRLACLEMIRTGTVRFWDMYWHPEATRRAVEDAGLRARVGPPLIDGGDEAKAPKLLAKLERVLDRFADGSDLVAPALAPHAIYTVSPPSLRRIAEIAAERELPVQIHVAETEAEVERCVAEHGVRPIPHLDRLGLLGPRTLLAHGVWLDRAELELVAERGATLVTNPVANLKLGIGRVFPYRAAREAGASVALGTDGAGSNNSLDLLQDAKFFALLQKHEARDAAAVSAGEAWALATGRLAPVLGATPLAAGRPADFLLVRAESPELAIGDLVAGLIYAASGAVVDTTVVAGRVLMRGGVVNDSERIVAMARERVRRLGLGGG